MEVRGGGHLFILDAGTGLRNLGRDLSASRWPVQADVLLSHYHIDHILGFPFFEPVYRPETELCIRGPARSPEALEAALLGPMDTIHLPVPKNAVVATLKFAPLAAELGAEPWHAGPFEVVSYPLRHPEGATGFRLTTDAASMAYVPDNELVGGRYRQPEGWYSGLVEFVAGVDLLLHDATFTDAEYAAREGWGHSSVGQAVRLAEDAGVRRLHLFHHAPRRTDAELSTLLRRLRPELAARGSDLELDAAREGSTIELPAAGEARREDM